VEIDEQAEGDGWMPNSKLILVKHATPQVSPDVPSNRWVLSGERDRQCEWLADALAAQGATRLYSSIEPKALETASYVARQLRLALHPRFNLHENDRTGLGLVNEDVLRSKIREFFQQTDRCVIGRETANSARRRFTTSVAGILAEDHGRPLAIVTHGTVLSLFVAQYNNLAPFELWSRLGLPSYVVLDAASLSFDGGVYNYPGG
jgi:broad specificity phosphatase PhoE